MFYAYENDQSCAERYANRHEDKFKAAEGTLTLDLSNSGLTKQEFNTQVLPFLKKNPKIARLDLSGNQLNGDDFISLLDYQQLTDLNFSRNKIDDEKETAKLILEKLKDNTTLYRLELAGCELGPNQATALDLVIRHNCTLTILNIAGNYFSSVQTTLLLKAIAANITIKALNIAHTFLSGDAPKALMNAVHHSKSLEILEFNSCNLDPGDAPGLFNKLKDYPALKIVDVSNRQRQIQGNAF